MVMDQFVTTYRGDYLWPYVRVLGRKQEKEELYRPTLRDPQKPLCACHCIKPPGAHPRAYGPNELGSQSWSRQGPMGPLLDPKLYPSRVGRAPEAEASRFNQPNVFLKKLQEKYPYIYEVLKTAPPDDMISRINKDRLRTTYQVDFCKLKEYPSAPYDQLLRAANVEGKPPCAEPVKLPGDPCRPNQKPIAFRPAVISGMKQAGKDTGGGKCGKGISSWDPFDNDQSKYDEVVKIWGQMVFRDTLHAHSSNSPGRACIIKIKQ